MTDPAPRLLRRLQIRSFRCGLDEVSMQQEVCPTCGQRVARRAEMI
jgi:hypothetical protein